MSNKSLKQALLAYLEAEDIKLEEQRLPLKDDISREGIDEMNFIRGQQEMLYKIEDFLGGRNEQ